jgi:LysM repeat protein
LALVVVLLLVAAVASACYKDAGENVEPTSNRVNLSDIVTPTVPLPTPFSTPTATTGATVDATPTAPLRPTITPADAGGEPTLAPTNTPPQIAPSFTPANTVQAGPQITTPSMSDIEPSQTAAPTVNPSLQPTPTGVPADENPCVHVVQPGDTLYSIARDNEVALGDLVAANPVLGGSELTPLQLGWELQIPGCVFGTPTATLESAATPGQPEQPEQPAPSGAQTTYVVQSGDTIYSIGRKFSVSPEAIVEANGLANPNRIYPGQTLIIPPAQ